MNTVEEYKTKTCRLRPLWVWVLGPYEIILKKCWPLGIQKLHKYTSLRSITHVMVDMTKRIFFAKLVHQANNTFKHQFGFGYPKGLLVSFATKLSEVFVQLTSIKYSSKTLDVSISSDLGWSSKFLAELSWKPMNLLQNKNPWFILTVTCCKLFPIGRFYNLMVWFGFYAYLGGLSMTSMKSVPSQTIFWVDTSSVDSSVLVSLSSSSSCWIPSIQIIFWCALLICMLKPCLEDVP